MQEKDGNSHTASRESLEIDKFQPNRSKGIIFAFISLLLIGFMPVISNNRPPELNALIYAFLLSFWELISSIPLLITELIRKKRGIFQKTIPKPVKIRTYVIVGITSVVFTISTFLYVFSLEKAGTVSASIAIQAYPMFSILLETVFLKKKTHWSEILFLLLIITGLYYLTTSGTWLTQDFSAWFLVVLLVPLLWSIGHVTLKNTIDVSPITPNQITFFRVLISSILLFGMSSLVDGIDVVAASFINWEFQLFGFLMGFIYYLELVNWFNCIKHVNVSVASSITTPSPIITALIVFLFLREDIFLYQIIGMIVIIVGLFGLIWIGNIFHRKRLGSDSTQITNK